MNRSILAYAGILALTMGVSWMRYTDDAAAPKEGVVLVDAKPAELEKVVYDAPELDVSFEMRTDDFGRYGWATVAEQKKKKVDGQEVSETKTTIFKAGTAADKLIESLAPLMAVRGLDNVDDATIATFGLTTPDTTVSITSHGKTTVLELGGETYGTKDRYVRNRETGRVYVVDDEPFKTLKFAVTRLPERSLMAAKVEEIDSLTLGEGGTSVEWAQKNKDDRKAAYWERAGASGKDETFSNWLDKALKIKSTSYVQDADLPAELVPQFDLTVRAPGKPAETVAFSLGGEDWYAKSESTRGLVKLTRGPTKDIAEEVSDILEGKTPPPDPEPPAKPSGMPGGMPPHGAGNPGTVPGMPPINRPPMPAPTPG